MSSREQFLKEQLERLKESKRLFEEALEDADVAESLGADVTAIVFDAQSNLERVNTAIAKIEEKLKQQKK